MCSKVYMQKHALSFDKFSCKTNVISTVNYEFNLYANIFDIL